MIEIDNIEIIHTILLEIAKKFHSICVNNKIPYYMLGGTMLGAIRHKGFIPWDDDMDFGVPRPYYNKLLEILEKDLKYPYRCCTYKNNQGVFAAFIKIDDCRTVVNDPRVRLPINQQIGINIDVFPLDYCQKDDRILKKIHRMLFIYQTIYVGNSFGSVWKNTIKTILSSICPISRIKMLDLIHQELSKMNHGEILTNVFGVWKERECVPFEWYGEGVMYPFANTKFYGLKEFDKYLSQLYGDYHTPPKGDKHIHFNNIYWREDNIKDHNLTLISP